MVTVKSLRTGRRGEQTAEVQVPTKVVGEMLRAGTLRVGWSQCAV